MSGRARIGAARWGLPQWLVVLCPFVLFTYPAAAVFLGTSEFPVLLQKYSYGAAAFNVVTLLLYAAFAASVLRGALLMAALTTIALLVLSYALPASNSVLVLPGTLPVLAATRLAASLALIVLALAAARGGQGRASPIALVAGALFLIPSLIDTAFLVSRDFRKPDATTSLGVGYRTNDDLSRLTDHDVVIVGDSFVWGQGVEIDQRFGDVLQASLRRSDPRATVYSLGIIGVGLKDYVKSLESVPLRPRVRRIVVAYYQNDMPPMDTLDGWMEKLSLAVGRSSISGRLLLDALRVTIAPDVDQYARGLLDSYREDGTDFAGRWRTLVAYYRTLYALASERSLERPILMIIPALVGDERAPWSAIHQRLAKAAGDAGFEVVDLFADFSVGTPEALRYRLAPNDLHFNVEGNRIVADSLARTLGK